MNRRAFIAGALSSPLAVPAQGFAKDRNFIGDMHVHSFFADSKYHLRPLAQSLAAGNASLVAWSLVGDLLWFDPKSYKQKSLPAQGEAYGWFQRELGRIKAHIGEQKLKFIRTPRDIDLAMRGDPHIVLAVEGANFIESDHGRVSAAHDAGIRQLQLVHYTSNSIGDLQTESPRHQGLSEIGKRTISECNRVGMLVDLAHCSEATTRAALAISRAPVVWSHGSIAVSRQTNPNALVWQRRQLSLDLAKEIAAKGGVIGLWAFAPDVGKTPESYTNRILEMVDWLGEDHVAFGTDINGIGPFGAFSGFIELKQVAEQLRKLKTPEGRIVKLAIGNYARVLKSALEKRA